MDSQKKNRVLAEGEATGHAHRCDEFGFVKDDVFHVVGDKSTVTHEEHKPVELDKGDYDISIVREFDLFEQQIREVRD